MLINLRIKITSKFDHITHKQYFHNKNTGGYTIQPKSDYWILTLRKAPNYEVLLICKGHFGSNY
jgi:hypothetical protein